MREVNHVAVLDFGSQYTQLIVRRVRELGYFARLYPPEDLAAIGRPGAIILSGGPRSTAEAHSLSSTCSAGESLASCQRRVMTCWIARLAA